MLTGLGQGSVFFYRLVASNAFGIEYGSQLRIVLGGTVSVWGAGSLGQTNTPADLTNVVAIAARCGSSLALRRDGTVVAWGDNSDNQLSVPVSIGTAVAIAAGEDHNLLLSIPAPLDPAALTISLANGHVRLEWAIGTLQSASGLSSPYQALTNASSPYEFAPSTNERFFRIQIKQDDRIGFSRDRKSGASLANQTRC